MKKFRILFVCAIFVLNTSLLKAANDDVQFIAVHIGNHENMSVLDKTPFPNFKFYYNDAKLIGYSEEQKLMGNPKYLVGWYGEVPEKMGFCANYRGSYGKGYAFPYSIGSIYVIDKEGTIGYQVQAEYFNEENYMDTYYKVMRDIQVAVKKFKKGKNYKRIKATKQEYRKESPIGELEKSKGASIDKKNEGITGWEVPELMIKNEKGETKNLRELTKGKVTVLVFFTLNSAHRIKSDAKGNITKEWDGQKLISPKDWGSNQEGKFMEGEYKDKKEAKQGFAKAMFKSAVATSDNGLAKLIVNNKEELAEADKMKAYQQMVQHLQMVESDAKRLKK